MVITSVDSGVSSLFIILSSVLLSSSAGVSCPETPFWSISIGCTIIAIKGVDGERRENEEFFPNYSPCQRTKEGRGDGVEVIGRFATYALRKYKF